MKKIFLLFFVVSSFLTEAFPQGSNPSTQGSEFYFSFPRANPVRTKKMTLTVSSAQPGVIKITDANKNSVTRPFNSGTTVINLASADKNDINEVVYLTGLTSCYQIASNTIDKRGYIVETFETDGTTPLNVSIYAGLSGDDTTDAANIYPIQALGNEYYVLSHVGYRKDNIDQASEALIVATDSTEIEIIPTCLLDDQAASEDLKKITITLKKGETYLIRAFGLLDLTGTVIRTKDDGNLSGNKCKKIAVFSGNQHGKPGDYEYEQIFPTHLLGNEYLISAPEDNGDNMVRIVATEACTEVKINGTLVATLNQTDYTDFELKLGSGCYIETNKPVGVALYTYDLLTENQGSGEDAAMIIVAPIEQKLDSIIFTGITNSDAPTSKVSIVAPTDNINDVFLSELIGTVWTPIVLNGWTTISANTNYSTVTIGISATSTYKIISQKGGFNAYVYGYGQGAEYGYSAGSAARPAENSFFLNDDPSLNSNNTIKPCIGNAVVFEANTPYSFSEIRWDFGDGARDTTYAPINTTSHPYAAKGTYTVQMIVVKTYSDCYGSVGLTDTATTDIEIVDTKGFRRAETHCKGETISTTRGSDPIFGGAPVKYYWEVTQETTPSIVLTGDHNTTRQYVVRIKDDFCHYVYDTIDVTIRPIYQSTQPAVNRCNNLSNIASSNKTIAFTSVTPYTNGNPIAYKWNTGETSSSITVTDAFGTTTKHWVEASAGCLYVDTIVVTVPAEISNSLTITNNNSNYYHLCGDGNTEVTVVSTQNGPATTTTWEMSENGSGFVSFAPNIDANTVKFVAANPIGTTLSTTFRYNSTGACQTFSPTVTIVENSPFDATLTATSNDFFPGSTTLPVSGGTVQFDVTTNVSGAYSYQWLPTPVSLSSSYSDFFDENSTNLMYAVKVTDNDQLCSSFSDTIYIKLDKVIINTLISHSSGKNNAIANDLLDKFQNGYKTIVYNRYGQLVSENIDSGWDGTYKGQKADAGVYFYVIEYRTDMGLKQIKGTVEVVK